MRVAASRFLLVLVGVFGPPSATAQLMVAEPTAEESVLRSYEATEAFRKRVRASVVSLRVVLEPGPLEDPSFQRTLDGTATAVLTAAGPRLVTSSALAAKPGSARAQLPSGQPVPAQLRELASGAGLAVYSLEPWPKELVPLALVPPERPTALVPYLNATGFGLPALGDQSPVVIAAGHLLERLPGEPGGRWVSDLTLPWGMVLLTADLELVAVTTGFAPGTASRAVAADTELLSRVLNTDEAFEAPDPFQPAVESVIVPLDVRGSSASPGREAR